MEYDPQILSMPDSDLVKIDVPVASSSGSASGSVQPNSNQLPLVIQVSAPDGSGRVINAIVPRHCKPGTSFLMKFPTVEEMKLLDDLRLNVQQEEVQVGKGKKHNANGVGGDTNITSNNNNNNNNTNTTPTDLLDDVNQQQQNPLEQRLLQDYDNRDTNTAITNTNTNAPTSSNMMSDNVIDIQSMMLVSVPPGVNAGTTIYAQIPSLFGFGSSSGERRFVPVKVPRGGVSQFYTCFTYDRTLDEKQVMEMEQERIARAMSNGSSMVVAHPYFV